MSLAEATADADLDLDGVTYDHVREVLDPLQHGWMPYVRVLTKWYMAREDRDWSPLGPHHARWFEDFDSGEDLIRLAHRGSLKTTSTLAYVLGNLEYRSGFHAAWIGNNETLAYEKAHSEVNKLTERNPWLTNLQEDSRTTDQKGKKEFANDSSLSVGWLFGGVEGRHVDLLVVDDLIKEKGDGDMQEIEDWLSSVIVPVQEHGGQTIVIGTRKTPTDVYSLLAEREGFDFVEYPAVLGEWDAHFGDDASARRPDPELYHAAPHPLHPDREARLLWDQRSTDYLQDARSKQSEHAWMREFCLVVQTREGAVYDTFDRDRHLTGTDPSAVRLWFTGLDWGSGNPAGFVQFAVAGDGTLVTVDEAKYPVGGTQDYVDTLAGFHDAYGTGPVGCDPSDKRGIDDLRAAGVDAIPAENDVHAGIRQVKDLLASGDLAVHERCEQLLAELGAYRYNQTTGEPVKKNDHLCFVAGTMVLTETGERRIETIRPGDRVLTRDGYRPVLAAGKTAEDVEVATTQLTNGRKLTGTPDHPVHTRDGFKPLLSLRYDEILTPASRIGEGCQELKQSNTRELHSADTPIRTVGPTGITTGRTLSTSRTASKPFTERSGKTTMDKKSQTGTSSTTRMGTPTTTIPVTSNASRRRNMPKNIPAGEGAPRGKPSKPRRNGTPQKRGGNGTENTGNTRSRMPSTKRERSATSAEMSSPTEAPRTPADSAPMPVRPSGDGIRELTTSRQPASGAGRHSPTTNTTTGNSVRVAAPPRLDGTADVYNLTVLGPSEYCAEGVLVHNCDAWRYGVMAYIDRFHGLADRDHQESSGISYL